MHYQTSPNTIFMKSIILIAFLAIAATGCTSPEQSTGSDTSTTPTISNDTAVSTTPMTTDTVLTTPVDTTGSQPMMDTTTVR